MIISFDQYQNVIDISILSFLSPQSKETVLASADIIAADIGAAVPRGPTPADLFILLEGEVIVSALNGANLFHSKPGKSFELGSLLSGSKEWKTRWICDKRCKFLKIPWPFFFAELAKDKTKLNYLSRITQSVQVQKLKRDMRSLNVSKECIVQLITSFTEESFDLILSDWTRKAFLTIIKGEIAISVLINNQKNKVAVFQAGDSCYLDLENSDFVYEASPTGSAYVTYDTQWSQFKNRADFEKFLKAYRADHEATDEATSIESTRVFSKSPDLKLNGRSKPNAVKPAGLFQITAAPQSNNMILRTGKYKRYVVIQDDEMRSGSAVLSTLARYCGHSIESDLFENKFPIHSGAKSLDALKVAADQFNFVASIQKFSGIQNLLSNTPLILSFTEKFVTVFEGNSDYLVVGDPETGQVVKMSMGEMRRRLVDDRFLTIRQNNKTSSKPEKGISFFNYFKMLFPFWWTLFLYFCAGTLSFFAGLAVPFLNQYIFDSVIPNVRKDLLAEMTIITIAIMILGALFDLFNQGIVARLKQALSVRLTSILHGQIFKTPAAYFKRGGFSAIIGRLSEIDTIAGFTATSTLSIALSLFLSVFSYGIMWLYDPKFVWVVILMVPIQMIMIKILSKRVIDQKIQASVLKSRDSGLIYQHFRSPENSRIVNGNIMQRWQYEKNSYATASLSATQTKYDTTFSITNFFCGEMVRIVIVIMAVYMYIHGQMSVGKVLAVSMIVPKITAPIQQIFQSFYTFLGVKASMRRLDHFFLGHKEMSQTKDFQKANVKLQGQVSLENVSYKYESTTTTSAIDQVTLKINRGEFIVVVGPSGSGKSTLAGLLGHLLVPTSGKIKIDGQDSGNYSLSHLRKEIGYVEQEGSLFSGTFQQNITMWSDSSLHEKVSKAAQIADIDDFILASKDGYASEVGSMGAGVSEGQKQRMLIARAIFANPSMLILDESTSHLDPISEERVLSRLIEEFKGKTMIFFTQRVHLASRADRIFYMENGRVAEMGSHKELIAKGDKYYEFFCSHLALG